MTILARSASDSGLEYSIIGFDADATDPASIAHWVEKWLNSDEMTELFALFGEKIESSGLRNRLDETERITRDIFDFRQGGERWEARKSQFAPRVTEVLESLIAHLYRDLQGPPSTEIGPVSHALVLGGRINSCILRGELLATLLGEGLEVGTVWGLGSRREATADEHAVAERLELGSVEDELDAMSAALCAALQIPQFKVPSSARDALSEVRQIAMGPIPVIGLAAAPGPGKPRATTSDTYAFFRETAGNISEDDHILIVTSAIHAPFQHAQAIAELGIPTGATITSVGAHIGTSRTPEVRHEWTTSEWLQEVRSTIWSMRNMYESLVEAHPELDRYDVRS
ncbi:hypothetical protein [Rhodococcus sp. 3-2]|uniref:hypothetical protein n=1 Tax=Rhodococcus sp. 3-2 TaxID=2890836 RepID=UPI001D187767|nr:hypothetical protein [Rhodococcus sp. 3-2]MCC4306270.1 hypothetical protein [Rhodococcus sp. 3-2]